MSRVLTRIKASAIAAVLTLQVARKKMQEVEVVFGFLGLDDLRGCAEDACTNLEHDINMKNKVCVCLTCHASEQEKY